MPNPILVEREQTKKRLRVQILELEEIEKQFGLEELSERLLTFELISMFAKTGDMVVNPNNDTLIKLERYGFIEVNFDAFRKGTIATITERGRSFVDQLNQWMAKFKFSTSPNA